jgi:hypothetical protein
MTAKERRFAALNKRRARPLLLSLQVEVCR